jgi:OmpA-OmpF porin, OOP family
MNQQGQPMRRVDEIRRERRETREGGRTVIREPDRVIVREGGRTYIRHNEVDRFRYNARDVRTEQRGSETVTVVERSGGTRIVTVTDDNGRLLRRVRRDPEGREVVIIDNRDRGGRGRGPAIGAGVAAGAAALAFGAYVVDMPPPQVRIPRRRYVLESEGASPDEVYGVLMAPPVERLERSYSLDEVRYSPQLRARMPSIDVDTITFDTGSWELAPDQAAKLSVIGGSIKRAIAENPNEVFLIEGHTDAVGPDEDNLSLSDRRAEAVALVLTEQFQVMPENLTSQGYGEQHLKVQSEGDERRNRRVTVRRITPLLSSENDNTGRAR